MKTEERITVSISYSVRQSQKNRSKFRNKMQN